VGDIYRVIGAAPGKMIWKAVKTSAFLSALFLVVYNGCNYITSLRRDVPSFYFSWERHIPFVPIFILPYMSIDLFFVAAPFIFRDERSLLVYRRRIVAAILVAGACFLMFPMRFAFERPEVGGWLGVIFNNFRNVDKPFNECPSLHMALRTILALAYARRFEGALRWVFRIWFSLIGFSTVLTYQHHVIDVAAGLGLGAFCVYLFQTEPLHRPVTVNRRVGFYYLFGAVASILTAYFLRGWWLLFLWPAISMSLVSSAYFGLGPGIFRKRHGRIPLAARIFLWPVLAGQWISLRHYARQCAAWHELAPGLLIGRKLSDAEARAAVEGGVTAVLDLSGEFTEAAPFRRAEYQQLSIMDLTAPSAEQMAEGVEFIRRHIEKGVVYVHCKAGYSRTAGIAGAFLLANGAATTAEDAIEKLKAARPAMVIRPEIRRALQEIARRMQAASK
jgi:membrane-associated phospholipid phosphatase